MLHGRSRPVLAQGNDHREANGGEENNMIRDQNTNLLAENMTLQQEILAQSCSTRDDLMAATETSS
uniref:Uncharacterized protein n=1 Tax=Arundo donax TaxID=35708 RepID=A0A0A9CX45_ARUDO